jgi:four helix bundle protein
MVKNDLLLRIESVTIRSHRDLIVWQKSIRLAVVIAELVKQFPAEERYGLTDQLIRGARSVHANIAEGHGRGTRKDYLSFLSIANGSIEETDSHLEEAVARRIVSANRAREATELVREIGRMLCVLRWRLKEGQKTRF